MAILLSAGPHPAHAVGRVTAAPGPCSLYVYSDETWSGCDRLPADALERPLLAKAARGAVAMMRAWRRREPDGLLPPLSEVPGEADSTDRVAHGAVLAYLQ
jgi:hypothetical protein